MSPLKGDAFQQMAEQAPEAGFAPVNFGRLTATPMVIRFKSGDSKHEPPERIPMKDGYQLKGNEMLELKIEVAISEMNPNIEFDYERSVAIRKSSAREKTDWSEIVLPSLIKVFGANWGEAILKAPYVEVEDVPNVNGRRSKPSERNPEGRVLTVPKFNAAFKNKAECAAAREKRFGSGGGGSSGSTDAEVTDAIVEQVAALIKSVGKDAALTMLANRPFGNFEPDLLISLAEAKA